MNKIKKFINFLIDSTGVVHDKELLSDILNSILKKDAYSLNENVTNKVWVDGKPIYRKVIQATAVSGKEQTISHNISNLDLVVDARILLQTDTFTAVNATMSDFGSYLYNWVIRKTNVTVYRSLEVTGTYYIILDYTKTTD